MPPRTWRRHAVKARNGDINKYRESSPEGLEARQNLAKFAEYISDGAIVAAEHHRTWIDYLCTGESNDLLNAIAGENTSILAPRGSAKSTWVAYWVAWVIGHNPGIQIIYVSYSGDVALSRSRIIKRVIEHPKYQDVFPHIRPGHRWSDTDWEIDKAYAGVSDLNSDYTLFAVGATGSITSRRSLLIVWDDPIKSSEAIANAEIRSKIQTNWREVIRPTLVPGGRVINLATRFRPDDIHCTDFIPAKGWTVIEQSAILEDEEGNEFSYWPERYPLEDLQLLRHDDPGVFSFQYQNKVIRITESSIDPDWIIKAPVPVEFEKLVIGLDLSATEKEKRDFTAFVLGGRKADKAYFIDLIRGRWAGNIDKIQVLLDLCLEWGVIEEDGVGGYVTTDLYVDIIVEAVAYQVSFQGDFRRIVHEQYGLYNLNCRPESVKGDKLMRLRGVSGLFQNELVVFNKYRNLGRLSTEFIQFGAIDHEDCADAGMLTLKGLMGRGRLQAADAA
jgi:phage terminase large subunit-like protein